MHGIYEEIDGTKTACQKRSPPPAVVFCAQVKVAQEYRSLRACDDEYQVDHGQEAEHVVELMRPDAVQNEEQLNEYAAERQNAAHNDAGQWACVKVLRRYLTRDLIGACWIFDHLFLEAKVRADENERCTNQEPQGEQSD